MRTRGFESLPPYILQVILGNGRLRAVDLANLEASSSMFRAPSGIEPYRFLSIAESAAHHSCQMHPVFEVLPPRALSELLVKLLARCEGKWKLVLHFLESLQRSSGRSTSTSDASPNILTAAGWCSSLIVNGKGQLYSCGMGGAVLGHGHSETTELEAPRRISLPASATRIVQISAKFDHAAFVTETGQVYTYGENTSCCCGVGERGQRIAKPTHVTALETIPCQQVITGEAQKSEEAYTMAITRAGEVYSWGSNRSGQLGHGNTQDEFQPRQIARFDGSDAVVQVAAGRHHALAVTKSGQLFSWGDGSEASLGHDDSRNELRPRRVEHGGFDGLFIVSVAAGERHSAAIDSSGHVYTWGSSTTYESCLGHGIVRQTQRSPMLVASLEDSRAIQVEAGASTTFVLLDNGTVHCFGTLVHQWIRGKGDRFAKSFVIEDHKVQSISCGNHHAFLVTKKGAVFGFGDNTFLELGFKVKMKGIIMTRLESLVEMFNAFTVFNGRASSRRMSREQWLQILREREEYD